MRMPRDRAKLIRRRIDELARDPRNAPNIKKLTDHPGYRLRVGDWRVIYLLIDERVTIHVIRIASRGEVYKMSVKILEANGKPAFAVLPIDEYRRLLEFAEDAKDAKALHRFAQRYAAGKEESIPASVVDRLLAGESPIRVWREHRGLTAARLADEIGVTPAHVSKLETGKGEPSLGLVRKLATALDVDIDSLVGVAD